MKPASGRVLVKKVERPVESSRFELVDQSESQYEVTHVHDDVTACKVGDLVLFEDYRMYRFCGEELYVVRESDIASVKSSPKQKK